MQIETMRDARIWAWETLTRHKAMPLQPTEVDSLERSAERLAQFVSQGLGKQETAAEGSATPRPSWAFRHTGGSREQRPKDAAPAPSTDCACGYPGCNSAAGESKAPPPSERAMPGLHSCAGASDIQDHDPGPGLTASAAINAAARFASLFATTKGTAPIIILLDKG